MILNKFLKGLEKIFMILLSVLVIIVLLWYGNLTSKIKTKEDCFNIISYNLEECEKIAKNYYAFLKINDLDSAYSCLNKNAVKYSSWLENINRYYLKNEIQQYNIIENYVFVSKSKIMNKITFSIRGKVKKLEESVFIDVLSDKKEIILIIPNRTKDNKDILCLN